MEWISGNVFIRPMGGRGGLRPGDTIGGHTHNFDHTSLFFCGRWRVRKWVQVVREDGSPVEGEWAQVVDFERDAPFHLLIEAHARHEFTFLGTPMAQWMEPYIGKLAPEDANAFRDRHSRAVGKAWCIYSHRTPQGDISIDNTGWYEAYQ
jgi:hypothetical protein